MDMAQLIQSVNGLTDAVKDAGEKVTTRLEELDHTLALIAARATPGAPADLKEVLSRVSSAAGNIVLDAVKDWEKRSGING